MNIFIIEYEKYGAEGEEFRDIVKVVSTLEKAKEYIEKIYPDYTKEWEDETELIYKLKVNKYTEHSVYVEMFIVDEGMENIYVLHCT